ncbi:hypothetical protein MMC24_006015 [Lignoscripta atroalba]|nr:hypothetical protein [Lignoscripta atroalba]
MVGYRPQSNHSIYSGSIVGSSSRCVGSNNAIHRRLVDLPGVGFHGREWFEVFRSQTAQDLPGLFRTDFWGDVLQVSHSEPAVLHASVALGALYQKSVMDDMSIPTQDMTNRLLQFSIKQYNKAVNLLNERVTATQDRTSCEILLMTCILFFCLELLRGHYGTAMLHLHNGRNILYDFLSQGRHVAPGNILILPSTSQSIECGLVEVFARLDIQSTSFGSEAPQYHLLTEKSAPSAEIRIPEFFASFLEARQNLDMLMNAILRFLGGTPDPTYHNSANLGAVTQRDRLLHRLQEWLQAFEKFWQNLPPSTNPSDAQRTALLRLHHRLVHVKLSVCLSCGVETSYDHFTADFEAIISSAADLLGVGNATTTGPAPPPRLPKFSLDIGLIQPLYFTAIKCRVPHLRRRALSALSSTPHREGMWDAALLATVAARIIQLEETGFEEGGRGGAESRIVLPESCRFFEVRVYILGDGSEGAVLHCKRRDQDMSGGWLVREEHCAFDDGALVKEMLG